MTRPPGFPTYEQLTRRLAEAEGTLGAISRGEVDGLIVAGPDGPRVFTLEGADAFYRALVEQMPEGAAAVNSDGRVVYANSCFATMLGLALETVIGADLSSFVLPFERTRLRGLLVENQPHEAADFTVLRADGEHIPVALSVNPVDGHEVGARCVVAVDLTRRQTAEAALRAADARFRGAFDSAPIGMALLDLDGKVEQVNPALCSLIATVSEALIGHQLPWLAREGSRTTDAFASLINGQLEHVLIEGRSVGAGDLQLWLVIQLTLVRGARGEPQHFIAQVQDESARRRHEQELRHVADHDGLTGLLNRRGFEHELRHHLAMTERYGGEASLVLLDVDHFKYINDTRGHHVGDQVLRQLAVALSSRLRASDVIARLGGDEFAILLPRGEADAVAAQLLDAARDVEVEGMGGARRLTISVGVVPLVDGGVTAGEVMAQADLAMYDAKEAGRDRVAVHDASPGGRSANRSRMTWLGQIEDAIATGQLLLDAQPIVDLSSGAVVQRELLVRLPSPDGRVPASEWFAVAERYGLAPAIDEWVVDRAFELLSADASLDLNVNVSVTSIGSGQLREHVREGLARTGVAASRITFEITETAAIGNIDAAVRFTEDLQSLGCRLALDDFGAGFGSFYYLKHLPFDDVKIDGEFVRDCVRNERDRAIIRAMVDVASSMSRRTVAECIEDAVTLQLVKDHAVDLAQGYHLGRPVPVSLAGVTAAGLCRRTTN